MAIPGGAATRPHRLYPFWEETTVDTIATNNPNQADEPVDDPAAADSQTLLFTAAEAVSVGLDGLSGRQLDLAARAWALLDRHATDDGRDVDGIEDDGAPPDVPDGPHDTAVGNRR
jgi:hypothetical protein